MNTPLTTADQIDLEKSLRELCDWMRDHTGPGDSVHPILVRAVTLLKKIDPSYPSKS